MHERAEPEVRRTSVARERAPWGDDFVLLTNQPVARRGVTLALGWAIASVVLLVANTLVYRVFALGRLEALQAGFELLWLAASVVLAVGILFIGTSVDRPALAWVLVGLIAVSSLLDLAFTLMRVLAPDSHQLWSLVSIPSSLFGLAERVVFLVLFVQLCGPKHPWALVVALVSGGLGALRTLISFTLPYVVANSGTGFLTSWYPWVMSVTSLITSVASLLLVLAARAQIERSTSSPSPNAVASARSLATAEPAPNPAADFGIGAVLLLVGIGVSVASYTAASSAGGGRYVVATGFIGVGLGRLIRGLIRSSKAPSE
jgi:hypothetical protein